MPRSRNVGTKTKKARIAGFFTLPALISGIYISVTAALYKVWFNISDHSRGCNEFRAKLRPTSHDGGICRSKWREDRQWEIFEKVIESDWRQQCRQSWAWEETNRCRTDRGYRPYRLHQTILPPCGWKWWHPLLAWRHPDHGPRENWRTHPLASPVRK